jgi:hypothetical protein
MEWVFFLCVVEREEERGETGGEEEGGRAFGFNTILPLRQGEAAEGRWSV